jgi:serine/threonine-protein kinase
MKRRLGHYDIVSELGRGGMGVVYKGYETSLHRYVAIKVLADALAHDEGIKERFLREARSMAALNDPHIIQIYAIDEDEGRTYFVMEFVEGESLSSMLKREHALSVEQAAKVIYQTALGLSTAHDRGVVHRDIKPGNLMISSRGMVKIADFGIALSSQDISKKLTSTGEFVGTPGYLSPEICLGQPVDRRSDIFSLGIVLFEMLAGRMPFTDESPLGLMLEVVKADIPDVRELNADADPEIARILARMIAKSPEDRYQDCHELAADLARHPLVAKGGPIQLQTRMSTAAATLIGQATPSPASFAQPITGPAPAPVSIVTPAAANTAPPVVPAAAPSGHRSVLDRPTTNNRAPGRSGAAMAGAIAAILVLGIATSAYAFRDRIPLLGRVLGTAPVAQVPVETDPSTLAPLDAIPDETPATQTSADHQAAESVASTATQETALSAQEPVATESQTSATATPDSTPVDETSVAANQAIAATEPVDESADRGTDPVSAETRTEPVTIAKTTPPKRATEAPRPRVPTIAVVSSGDDVISGPAEDAIGDLLRSRGFRVIDGGHAGGDRPDLHALRGRADAVLFVHARPVGSQELTYYGQSSTLYTVQLGVKAYRVANGEVLWSSGSEQVNFTTLNAADQAREAIGPMLDNVDANLDEFRPRGGRG